MSKQEQTNPEGKQEVMLDTNKPNRNNNNNGSNNRSNKNNSGKKDSKKGRINDASFYYPDMKVAESIQSYSFNEYGGVEVSLDAESATEAWKTFIPNVMSIQVNPSVPITSGITVSGQSGIQATALRNFNLLTMGNAKNFYYGVQDPLMCELAVGNMISTRGWLMRGLSVITCVDFRQRAIPEELLNAMHIDAQDMRKNLANYRNRFNTITAKANKIPFPGNVAYFKKCAAMFANIYKDDDKSVLAQMYMFNPSTVWVIDEQYDENGTGLRTTAFIEDGVTKNFGQYLDIWEAQIDALLNSTTLNYVYSDILRLVSKGKISEVVNMTSLSETTDFKVVYNTEIQLWVHNMWILGKPANSPVALASTPKNDISCDADTNKLKYNPEFPITNSDAYHGAPTWRLIDFYTENPNIEDRVAATRLCCPAVEHRLSENNTWYRGLPIILDWYVVKAEIFSKENDTPLTLGNMTNNVYEGSAVLYSALSHFRWSPISLFSKSGQYDGHSRLAAIHGELNYYTVMTWNMLYRMYDYEIINLLSFDRAIKL